MAADVFPASASPSSGDRGRSGGDGGREDVLRRMPHHHHSHVAQRADGAEGEFPTSPLFFLSFLFVLWPVGEVIGGVNHGLITTALAVHTAIVRLILDYIVQAVPRAIMLGIISVSGFGRARSIR